MITSMDIAKMIDHSLLVNDEAVSMITAISGSNSRLAL